MEEIGYAAHDARHIEQPHPALDPLLGEQLQQGICRQQQAEQNKEHIPRLPGITQCHELFHSLLVFLAHKKPSFFP